MAAQVAHPRSPREGMRATMDANQLAAPNKASAKDVAENFVLDLLSRIQPAPASEMRRKLVARYVQDTIKRAFQPAVEVQAFMYGSVPLKTYLPDGDIDLAIFQSRGNTQHLRDTWFTQLSGFLQREEQNPHAPFRIRDVQVIYAEVKLVKCLVDNIVVDISFQSLGGLCTVNFLEAIDRRIDDHHLFKRSIILVKAWCYYESRLLGAHHGLISTYALETMVLYIFILYHQSVTSPLKVLHRFLTVFSTFNWDNMCLSVNGPIPLNTFPNPKPIAIQAAGQPLFKEESLADIRNMFKPPGLATEAMPTTTPRSFQLKFLNIMDPLLPTNNLGRSVNRASFARVKRAFGIGAKRLTELLEMDVADGSLAVKSFFRNTWNAQRTTSTRPPLQEASTANSQAPVRQNGSSSAQAGYPTYSPHQSLHRWMPQTSQNGGMIPVPPLAFASRQSLPVLPRSSNGQPSDSQKSEAQSTSTSLRKAQSGELSAKGSSMEALENGESPGKKAIPARKGSHGGPQASNKLKKLSSQNGSPPEVPGRIGAWKEPPGLQNSPMTLPVCIGHQMVINNNQPQVFPVFMPMHLQQFNPAAFSRQIPMYYQQTQPTRPPLTGFSRNGQPLTGQGQSKSVPNTSKGQKSLQLGNARYSDPGSTAADRQESTDVTLSGELEDLNNHLDAARAMFNGGAAAGLHVQRARHDAPDLRTPLRPSSSMGNLAHQKFMAQNGWQHPFAPPGHVMSGYDLQHAWQIGSSYGNSNQKPRTLRPPQGMPENQQIPRASAPESLASTSGPPGSSERGSSRAESPTLADKPVPNPATPAPGPHIGGSMEWPVLGGKNANWAPESVGAVPRSTASEGRPGWASPGASAESAMSIAAVLQNLRLDDRAASPATLNQANVVDANQASKSDSTAEWQKEFALDNDKDFPGLPNARPPVGGAGRIPEPQKSWRPTSSRAASST